MRKQPTPQQRNQLLELLLRSATFGGEDAFSRGQLSDALELVEACLDVVAEAPSGAKNDQFDDWFFHLAGLCARVAVAVGEGEYLARKADGLAVTCRSLAVHPDQADERRTGVVEKKQPG